MANLAVRLQPAIADPTAAGSDLDGATAITRADGTFTLINVPTGQYVMKVLRASPSESLTRMIRWRGQRQFAGATSTDTGIDGTGDPRALRRAAGDDR
jgi:hypothetical protein